MKNKVEAFFIIIDKIINTLTKCQLKKSLWAFVWMLISSVFELLGVTMIVPFIMAMMDTDTLVKNKRVSLVLQYLGMTQPDDIIVICGMLVVLVYLFKNITLLYARYMQNKFCRTMYQELSVTMLESYMERSYEYFINVSTANLLRGINVDVNAVVQILQVLFSLAAEMLTVFLIVGFILVTDPITAISVATVSLVIVLVITLGTKNVTKKAGAKYRTQYSKANKTALEIMGGIKDIFVTQRQDLFINRYKDDMENLKKTNMVFATVNSLPERIIEFGVVCGLILIVTWRVLGGYDFAVFIPQLAALALACFRLLPSLQKVTNGFNQIIFHYKSIESVYDNVTMARKILSNNKKRLLSEEDKFIFENEVSIEHISWKYESSNYDVLDNLSLVVHKGESVALIGKSGSGKTTLADVILGLFKPQKGFVMVDGIDVYSMPSIWAKQVGYVPQSVFLTDDTIRNNVAFGIEKTDIDDTQIWRALGDAQLEEFVRSLPNGLDTIVGERGVKFSGGQRQRIAIARVMYYNPEILVLDEATSALDDDTEKAVMEAIDSLQGKKTLIIIAHRLSTIKNCDRIYEIVDGKAIERDKEEVLGDSE